jgi:ankyrin repeat protein
MSLAICLPADVWMNIFFFLPQTSRPILSNVCALFDAVVHERLPWNLAGVPLSQKQVEIILESASKRNYQQFLVMFIQQCPKWLTSSSLSSSGKKGHACLLSAFFKSGCVESDDFYKPLAQAAFEGNTEVIALFIKNMWQNDRGNQNAAIVALKNNQNDFVKTLIENQTLSKESVASILHNAIKDKECGVVASVLDLNYCHPETMTDAIVQAAQDGALEILTLVISRDVCSEQGTDLGLAAAAENNRLECVQLFIEKKRFTLSGKKRAALQAVAAGHLQIVQYLYDPSQGDEALVIAARKNRTPIVDYLLKEFALGEGMKEALKAAAESGSLESFNALKSEFLNECKDEIALLAAKNGHLSILEAMNQKQYSQKVVHAAIFHNHPLVVKSCIEKKWVKELPFDDLLESIKRGDFAIVACLLNSCFKTLTYTQRYTLFNYAITFFNIFILRVIIESRSKKSMQICAKHRKQDTPAEQLR